MIGIKITKREIQDIDRVKNEHLCILKMYMYFMCLIDIIFMNYLYLLYVKSYIYFNISVLNC